MIRRLIVAVPAAVALTLFLVGPALAGVQADADQAAISGLLDRLESAIDTGDRDAAGGLLAPDLAAEDTDLFVGDLILPDLTRSVLVERDRARLTTGAGEVRYRSLVEIFTETGQRARIVTWRLEMGWIDAVRDWRIIEGERLTSIDGLYQLSLDVERQYDARDLTIRAQDLTLRLPRGAVFQVRVDAGVTALVLVGDGEMVFSPEPAAERGQLRIFAGDEVLRAPFRSAFVRLHPHDYDWRISGSLTARSIDSRDLRRAREIFDEFVGESFGLDVSDLSRQTWSLLPSVGDFLAEIQTRRLGSLTYTRSMADAEDVTLFDRRGRRNISVYASPARLATRGRFYDEDQMVDFEVLHYYLDVAIEPEREWIRGRVRLRIRVRRPVATVTVRLAETLTVESLTSDELGRLLHARARGQNSLLVSLPRSVARDEQFYLDLTYSGALPAQAPEREAITAQIRTFSDLPAIEPEAAYVYSNRSYWYPQSVVSDYATATLHITVPDGFEVVASGERHPDAPFPVASDDGDDTARQRYTFVAAQPVRYLSCVIARLQPAGRISLTLENLFAPTIDDEEGAGAVGPRGAGVFYDTLDINVRSHPRQVGRAGDMVVKTADITRFYGTLLGDIPYPTFTLAVIEDDVPGGHSPAYFATLYQPPLIQVGQWRSDPVYFEGYPPFFLAHELAHQWWGQAVGWKNYHEQWISEGFAQYFAALYAEHDRGEAALHPILRQMRRSVMERTDQGPISLGYRLGHIRGDGRVFRAIAYNKSALVLHMLRRMAGDGLFFDTLRRFYHEFRFRKAGTDDVRRVFEEGTGLPLERFFERWILEDRLPQVNYAHAIVTSGDGQDELLVRFEQAGSIFDLAVTVTVNYHNGVSEDLVAVLDDQITDARFPVRAAVRSVDVNRDGATPGQFRRTSMPRADTGSPP